MKNEQDERDAWTGDDPEAARLEALLRPLRYEPRPLPALPRRGSRGRGSRWLAIAATLALIAAGAAWIALGSRGWWVQNLGGRPVVEGIAVDGHARVRAGEWLTTDGSASARLAIGQIGNVVVLPNSRVRVMESGGREHRIALERGTIQARIWAPPRFFFVETPSAVAVDLGCVYSLSVDETGAGLLRVTQGWVSLEHEGQASYIPEGAVCLTKPGTRPGTPRYDDAPSGYGAAVWTLDFGEPGGPERAAALDHVLSTARRRDALTLWHLLSRGSSAERTRVYDRLADMAPPPAGVTREAILNGDRRALDEWWDAIGIYDRSWWRFLKGRKKIVD